MVGCEVRPIKYLGGMFSGLGIMDGPHGPVVRIISEAPQVPESTYRSWAGSLMGPNSHDWMVFEETAKSGGGSMTSSAHSRARGLYHSVGRRWTLSVCSPPQEVLQTIVHTVTSNGHGAADTEKKYKLLDLILKVRTVGRRAADGVPGPRRRRRAVVDLPVDWGACAAAVEFGDCVLRE